MRVQEFNNFRFFKEDFAQYGNKYSDRGGGVATDGRFDCVWENRPAVLLAAIWFLSPPDHQHL